MNYEIHVTVDANIINIDLFKEMCRAADAKPLVIQNLMNDGSVYTEFVTSCIRECDSDHLAKEVLKKIYYVAVDKQIPIIRGKIERPPSNYIDYGYLETHIQFPKTIAWNALKDTGFYFSRVNDKLVGTYRSSMGVYPANFRGDIEKKFGITDFEVEWCIYDTNEALDAAWIRSYMREKSNLERS